MKKPSGIIREIHNPDGMGWRYDGHLCYRKTMLIEFDGTIVRDSEEHELIRDYAYERAGTLGHMELLTLRGVHPRRAS